MFGYNERRNDGCNVALLGENNVLVRWHDVVYVQITIIYNSTSQNKHVLNITYMIKTQVN